MRIGTLSPPASSEACAASSTRQTRAPSSPGVRQGLPVRMLSANARISRRSGSLCGTLTTRVVPPIGLGSRRARHIVERNVRVYRYAWVVLFSGSFEPLFYLFSIGVGIGELVGDITGPR